MKIAQLKGFDYDALFVTD
ncbi:hypothetical protein SS209_02792 [Salmonella enterica subsp. enterica serovar Senftenberg str. SS209]|nr:hypothetical protein SS209_02792 [Salmonella enterica subsp. enterica serovar Senftenberg str. SS209]